MRYEEASSIEDLNQKVIDYESMGYKVENRSDNFVKLVKDDFSIGIFIILFLFLIIGALIYWAVKSGTKDEVIIRLEENSKTDDLNSCDNCGAVIKLTDSKFCPSCGSEIE